VSGVSTTNGYARQAIELDVVLGRDPPQGARGLAPQRRHVAEHGVEGAHRLRHQVGQLADRDVALGVAGRRAALLHLAQAVVERLDQLAAPARVVQQVVDQVGIALDHPDVAQHLVEHAGRAAGAALGAQALQQLPAALAQQANDDLAIGEAGVVVGDLTQSRGLCGLRQQRRQRGRSIHRGVASVGRCAPINQGWGF
jgi:hypothetical protein